MKDWFRARAREKSTWYGVGTLIAVACGQAPLDASAISAIMAGLGLVAVKG